ncbi:hypothetical protein FISHEDRAFT_41672 [Fistulina hepatica ATCC 64428]|nr:hypothetical protein FISHEDRAFT_41672 [Fistulina hepatica ATCC 64428]
MSTTSASRRSFHIQPIEPQPDSSNSGIPVTPAMLRGIFASSRTPNEERSISRIAFFRFTGFLLSCICISLAASRGRSVKSGAALLGVV